MKVYKVTYEEGVVFYYTSPFRALGDIVASLERRADYEPFMVTGPYIREIADWFERHNQHKIGDKTKIYDIEIEVVNHTEIDG